jgi:hypothetical protein
MSIRFSMSVYFLVAWCMTGDTDAAKWEEAEKLLQSTELKAGVIQDSAVSVGMAITEGLDMISILQSVQSAIPGDYSCSLLTVSA